MKADFGKKKLLTPAEIAPYICKSPSAQASMRTRKQFPIAKKDLGGRIVVSIYALARFIGEDDVGSALGFETPHRRAMKVHAEAMKKWRETVKELRQQDEQAWERMKASSAIAPLARKQRQPPPSQLHQTPKTGPSGPNMGPR